MRTLRTLIMRRGLLTAATVMALVILAFSPAASPKSHLSAAGFA
jgi:hypothetical protein